MIIESRDNKGSVSRRRSTGTTSTGTRNQLLQHELQVLKEEHAASFCSLSSLIEKDCGEEKKKKKEKQYFIRNQCSNSLLDYENDCEDDENDDNIDDEKDGEEDAETATTVSSATSISVDTSDSSRSIPSIFITPAGTVATPTPKTSNTETEKRRRRSRPMPMIHRSFAFDETFADDSNANTNANTNTNINTSRTSRQMLYYGDGCVTDCSENISFVPSAIGNNKTNVAAQKKENVIFLAEILNDSTPSPDRHLPTNVIQKLIRYACSSSSAAVGDPSAAAPTKPPRSHHRQQNFVFATMVSILSDAATTANPCCPCV